MIEFADGLDLRVAGNWRASGAPLATRWRPTHNVCASNEKLLARPNRADLRSGPMGGNMDLNDLGEGTSVYFPVFQPGAQFFTGDPHQVQGNGEVSGTALEQSNTVTLQFILHKNGGLTGPRAETSTHYIFLGIDTDHNTAVQLALKDALDFQAEKGLSPADAMAFASLAVDLDIAESVDFTVLVMARVPKLFFKGIQPAFSHKPLVVRNEAQRQVLELIPEVGGERQGPGLNFSGPQ
jgi:acetamidase/formamidase